MNHDFTITLALDALKVLQFADNPNHGYWNLLTLDQMIDRLNVSRGLRFKFTST